MGCTSLRHAWAVAFAMLFGALASKADVLDDLIDSVEVLVDSVADEATTEFLKRYETVPDCVCSPHACGSDFASSDTCHDDIGDSVLCPGCSGQKLDFNNSFIITPPGTDLTNLTADMKDSICTFHKVDEIFNEARDDFGIRAWTYIATTNGIMRSWPGHAMERGDDVPEDERDETLRDCWLYDPRIRPWYVAATSGPKDVVLVVDTSGSMLRGDGEMLGDIRSRWTIAKKALLNLVDTFGITDYVNMVEFNSDVKALVPDVMMHATEENLILLKAEIEAIDPQGGTDFRLALETAFNLLLNATIKAREEEELSSAQCQKIIIFVTDGEDCTTKATPCAMPTPEGTTPVDAVLEFIEEAQQKLVEAGSQRAHIFSYSFGFEADDEIPKEMACANEGVWNRILPGDDPLFKMNAYTSYLATKRGEAEVIWSRAYDDAFGLGRVVTAARPIYGPKTSVGEDGGLVGVVGHDVRFEDFEAAAPDFLDAIRRFIGRGIQCIDVEFGSCDLQLLRGDEGQCPEKFDEASCYFFEDGNSYYMAPKQPLVSFDGADDFCKTLGGALAEINFPEEHTIMAGLAANAGSWIGLTRDRETGEWAWQGSNTTEDPESEIWAFLAKKELDNPAKQCAMIDRRGLRGNVHPESCRTETHVLCEFPGPDAPDACKDGTIITINEEYEYNVKPVTACRPEEERLRDATAISPAAPLLPEDRVICPLGEPQDTFAVRCCDSCSA